MIELTIQAACQNPQNFMYIWANDKFLNAIPKQYANEIRTKKANQNKLLMLSAEKYGKTLKEYTDAIRQAFIDNYTMTPIQALIVLAQGGQVAGKNWKEGVYGIGALNQAYFNGHPEITVRPEDGHILNNGADVTDTTKTVYTTIKKQAVAYQLFATIDEVIYMSQYNKTLKKYYAQSYSTAEKTYNARTGNEINASDAADIWGAVMQSLEKFVQWLISLFAGSSAKETINAANTLPNQSADGFVTESGLTDATTLLLLLAAGGTLIAGGFGKKKKVK